MNKSVADYRNMLLKEELDANDIFSDILFTLETEGSKTDEGYELNGVKSHSWGKTNIIKFNDFEAIKFYDGEIKYEKGDINTLKQILDSL